MRPSETNAGPGVSASRRALSGFFLSGVILSFTGAILPAWEFHLRPHYVTIGNYFLSVVAGVLAAVPAAPRLLRARGTAFVLALACWCSFCALILLSFTAPPVHEAWRLPCLLALGFGASLLNAGIFQAISPAYKLNPAGTVNVGGICFGLGSLLTSLLIAGTFHLYSVTAILSLVSLIPALFAVLYSRLKLPSGTVAAQRDLPLVLKDFRTPGAILLSLLLFFHFGNEWAIAGWLPLFLILRLGLNPVSALVLVAAYWLALIVGRAGTQAILSRVAHRRLLFSAALASLLGILFLTFTNNLFGAWFGTLLIGFGFAPVYPLVVEAIGQRFPYYHPGFFNGIFSAGVTGGMLAPAVLGYAAEFFGIRAVMVYPAIGTFVVVLLVVGIWLEAKIAEWNSAKPEDDRVA